MTITTTDGLAFDIPEGWSTVDESITDDGWTGATLAIVDATGARQMSYMSQLDGPGFACEPPVDARVLAERAIDVASSDPQKAPTAAIVAVQGEDGRVAVQVVAMTRKELDALCAVTPAVIRVEQTGTVLALGTANEVGAPNDLTSATAIHASMAAAEAWAASDEARTMLDIVASLRLAP